jgi:hypothetical protein
MKLRQTRRDPTGPIRLMAEADGYVMVRRPGCLPFVLSAANWLALPLTTEPESPRDLLRDKRPLNCCEG